MATITCLRVPPPMQRARPSMRLGQPLSRKRSAWASHVCLGVTEINLWRTLMKGIHTVSYGIIATIAMSLTTATGAMAQASDATASTPKQVQKAQRKAEGTSRKEKCGVEDVGAERIQSCWRPGRLSAKPPECRTQSPGSEGGEDCAGVAALNVAPSLAVDRPRDS